MIGLKYAKYHKQYIKLTSEYSNIQELFNQERVNAGCDNCDNSKKEKKKKIDEWCENCKSDKACKKVVKIHNELISVKDKLTVVRDNYAEVIFNNLLKKEVKIINIRTKQVSEFSEIYGNTFSSITSEKKDSLVSLIEEDGGLYRVK